MGEPSFYVCKKCGKHWERYEFKMQRNPPRECPNCGAGHEHQVTDQQKEDAYVGAVYAPMAKVLFEVGSDEPKFHLSPNAIKQLDGYHAEPKATSKAAERHQAQLRSQSARSPDPAPETDSSGSTGSSCDTQAPRALPCSAPEAERCCSTSRTTRH